MNCKGGATFAQNPLVRLVAPRLQWSREDENVTIKQTTRKFVKNRSAIFLWFAQVKAREMATVYLRNFPAFTYFAAVLLQLRNDVFVSNL